MNWNRRQWCALSLAGISLVLTTSQVQSNPRPPVPAPAAAEVKEVKIDNFSFSPAVLTVAPGTTVKWTNRDDIPHTVVSDDKTTFKSKLLDTDETFSFTFSKSGTYDYFCSVHPKMTAKVIVQ
ncbi:MAG TPA: cupredoxin family copper-binding protein [Dongiaceae bacterium]|nr:cupredoxin family copper-binding protein [Dongiaceae bacterium]